MIFLMTNNFDQAPSPALNEQKSKRATKVGRKTIDPSLKAENKKNYVKEYKQTSRAWQAYLSPELIDRLDNVMQYRGFKNKQQLLEWLLERKERSLTQSSSDT